MIDCQCPDGWPAWNHRHHPVCPYRCMEEIQWGGIPEHEYRGGGDDD